MMVPSEVLFAQAQERLQQEHAVFEQTLRNQNRWFLLRLAAGAGSLVLLFVILAFAIVVITNHDRYPDSVVTAASGALFIDALGVAVTAWRSLVGSGTVPEATPITAEPDWRAAGIQGDGTRHDPDAAISGPASSVQVD